MATKTRVRSLNAVLSLVAMMLLVSCGIFKKPSDKHDNNDLNNKQYKSQPMSPEDYAEAKEIARLNSLYNPWQLPPPNLEQDGLGMWRRGDIAYLRPGLDSLKARMQLLDNATRSVRIQTFVLSGDETGQAFANKLIELAERGVDVHLIIDDTTAIFKGSQSLYFYLTSHGIKVTGYRPIWMQAGNNPGVFERIFGGTTFNDRFGGAFNVAKIENHRFHEKIMVIDAEIPGWGMGMVGGTNIANEYYEIIGQPGELKWRDQDMLVRGDIVADLAAAFDSNLVDIDAVNNNAYFSDTIEDYVSGKRGRFGDKKANGIELRPYAIEQYYEAMNRNLKLRWNTANIRQIHHRPLRNELTAEKRFVNAINNAQREVIVVNPYIIPSEEMMKALIGTARRGVNIKILTNSFESGDTEFVQEVGRMFYRELILQTQASDRWPQSVPISIYEWGGDSVFKNGYSNFHAKYALFDRQIALIGSFNLDPRSSVWNSEVLYETDSPLLVAQLLEQQEHDSGPNYARIVTKEMAESYISGGNAWERMRREVLKKFRVFL